MIDPKEAIKGDIIEKKKKVNKKREVKKVLPFNGYKKKKDMVAILGTASTLQAAPFGDDDYEIWACSPVLTHKPAQGKKFDLLFEMHGPEYYLQDEVKQRLNGCGIPIYMQKKVAQIQKSMCFPFAELSEEFRNHAGKEYFTSTISYMIALAIHMDYKQIELFGVHMASTEEYGKQRRACEYWIGVANGKGIYAYIPSESELCHAPYLYGYQSQGKMVTELIKREKGLIEGKRQLKVQLEDIKKQYNKQVGAIEDVQHLLRRHS